MTSEDILGTNADGSKNEEYCSYCFKDGAFTTDLSMDAMVDLCAPYMVSGTPGMKEADARDSLKKLFPTLKRWQS